MLGIQICENLEVREIALEMHYAGLTEICKALHVLTAHMQKMIRHTRYR